MWTASGGRSRTSRGTGPVAGKGDWEDWEKIAHVGFHIGYHAGQLEEGQFVRAVGLLVVQHLQQGSEVGMEGLPVLIVYLGQHPEEGEVPCNAYVRPFRNTEVAD